MRKAQLITQDRDGRLVALSPGVGTDQVVRLLVERGIAVYEVAPLEQTLEDFYLLLMNGQREGKMGDNSLSRREVGVPTPR